MIHYKTDMPGRKIPLVAGEIYHVLNRGVASQPTFRSAKDHQRAMDLIPYYRNAFPPLRFSKFMYLPVKRRTEILQELTAQRQFLVEIVAYCLMPNHFHFLLRQTTDDGISKFASQFTNSYTRYFNTKYKRIGPVFQGKFKAIRVETEEQLLHLSRYIHLNPATSYVVKTTADLEEYLYSSLPEYLQKTDTGFCQKKLVLNHFKTPATYKNFVFDQVDYQRRLQEIEHLILEEP